MERESVHGRGKEFVSFPLGHTVATPGAIDACLRAGVWPHQFFKRHSLGDWGDLCEEDRLANEHALQHGGRLFSAYDLETEDRLWVITEADHYVTTLLTPMEY